jgi:hypothetical protein
LISEGSSKLASVPSGGSGGGAAAASGGAAAGGAPAEEAKEEAKEEGMLFVVMESSRTPTDTIYREGRVRRGYGFWSFRLSSQLLSSWIRSSRLANTCNQGFWEELCALCQWFACHGGERSDLYWSSREEMSIMQIRWNNTDVLLPFSGFWL